MSLWDQRYAEPGFAYGREPNEFLVHAVNHIIGLGERRGAALCLAEGEGRNALFLASLGFEVTAVDSSSVGLAKANSLAKERGLSLHTVVADLAEFVVAPGHFALIVSIWCHLPGPLRASVHGACVRGLCPGGALVLEAYTPAQLAFQTGGPRDLGLLMSLDELRGELRGLEWVHGVEIEREVHEGVFHHGKSSVVQVVARAPCGAQ